MNLFKLWIARNLYFLHFCSQILIFVQNQIYELFHIGFWIVRVKISSILKLVFDSSLKKLHFSLLPTNISISYVNCWYTDPVFIIRRCIQQLPFFLFSITYYIENQLRFKTHEKNPIQCWSVLDFYWEIQWISYFSVISDWLSQKI